MSAATAPMHFDERPEPGIAGSAVLAVLVHVLLFAVLFFGVRWQSRPPESISVELWVPPPPVEQVEVKPAPAVEPSPPPKPEPVVEPPKPDIAIQAKPEVKPKPKPEPPKPKPEPPKPKPEAVKPKPEPARPRDDEMQKRMRDELAREQGAVKIDRERQELNAAAQKSALSAYAEKIKAKVKGNWILPIDLKGNPEAVFDVIQLPTGEVLAVKLRKPSGNVAYDTAVERAILKSSPLPKPDKGELFQRELILTFRPRD